MPASAKGVAPKQPEPGSHPTVLVIGGSGMVGRPVVMELLAEGYAVRVLSRYPERIGRPLPTGLELVAGDVEDSRALGKAMLGCQAVHLSLSGGVDPDLERRGAVAVLSVAKDSQIERITMLSGASVCAENCWFEGTRAKFMAEAAIRSSGIPYTIFKAAYFMETLRRFVRGRFAVIIGRQPYPYHWIAAQDFARMVVRAFSSLSAVGRDLYVFGPASMTLRQALSTYVRIAHPGTRFLPLSVNAAAILSRATRRAELAAALPFFRYCESAQEHGDPAEANALLGTPATTIEQWSAQEIGRSNAGWVPAVTRFM